MHQSPSQTMPLTENDIHKEALARVASNGETKWERVGIVDDVRGNMVFVRFNDGRMFAFKQGVIRVIDRE